jgi:hypothetical protein
LILSLLESLELDKDRAHSREKLPIGEEAAAITDIGDGGSNGLYFVVDSLAIDFGVWGFPELSSELT